MRWASWADLRNIGNSSAVRAAIVVPVIGYFLVLNATVAEYLKMHGIEAVRQPASLWDQLWSIKLYLIYFGLMFLGLGSAIYQLKCPHYVKKYGDWTDYVAGTAPHLDMPGVEALAAVVGEDYEDDRLTTERQSDLALKYLRIHYALLSSESEPWRIVAAMFFGAGFLLLAVPSIMTACRVAGVLMKTLF